MDANTHIVSEALSHKSERVAFLKILFHTMKLTQIHHPLLCHSIVGKIFLSVAIF